MAQPSDVEDGNDRGRPIVEERDHPNRAHELRHGGNTQDRVPAAQMSNVDNRVISTPEPTIKPTIVDARRRPPIARDVV